MMLSNLFRLGSVWVFAAPLWAADKSAAPAARTLNFGDALNWSISLVLVLAVFFLCVWLMRKSSRFAATGKSQLGVVSGLSLGMREKVVLINVGEKQLLLGVTPGRIDKLLELEGDQRLFRDPPGSDVGEFAGKLLQVMKRKTDE